MENNLPYPNRSVKGGMVIRVPSITVRLVGSVNNDYGLVQTVT
jgi:hypothetical protein